jgi:hypothetical protein
MAYVYSQKWKYGIRHKMKEKGKERKNACCSIK